jgi:O-antigen ligase
MDGRLQAQELAFEKWLEKPVLGWGIGEFRLHHRFEYPHNLLLESLMELGLVGTTLLFSVCVVAILASLRILVSEIPDWVQAALALLFLTDLLSHLTVQGYLADDRIFFMYLGMVVASPGLSRFSDPARPEGRFPSSRPPIRRVPVRTPMRVSDLPDRPFATLHEE